MLRLALIPFVFLVLLLLSVIVIWFVYIKVKNGIGYTIKKGAEIAKGQQQKWSEKEQRKKFPEILQKGFSDYDKISTIILSLPEEWQLPLKPIGHKAKDILDEVALDFENSNNRNNSTDEKTKTNEQNKKLNSVRSFFIHSLDALLQFVEKLDSDYQKMSVDEIEKARQNINVFKADLINQQETLHKVRSFDFDVAMDVIKARLK